MIPVFLLFFCIWVLRSEVVWLLEQFLPLPGLYLQFIIRTKRVEPPGSLGPVCTEPFQAIHSQSCKKFRRWSELLQHALAIQNPHSLHPPKLQLPHTLLYVSFKNSSPWVHLLFSVYQQINAFALYPSVPTKSH